jgi:uncharacterized protein YkwD
MPPQIRHLAAAVLLAIALLAAQAQPSRADVAGTTLTLINAVRHHHGLHALRLNAKLSSAARAHSRDMVRRRYFSHDSPEGLTPVERIRGSGYLRTKGRWMVGETLAWGWRRRSSPARIVAAWLRSPPHRRVMLTPSFRDVGIGVAQGVPRPLPRGGATYTADFGVKR